MYQGQKILLIDDDPTVQDIYGQVLKSEGYNFSIATTGAEGVAKAKAEKPSLILLDLMLPDISGIDVLTQLRQNPATAPATVWILTNLGSNEVATKAISLGANDFIAKPASTARAVAKKLRLYFNPQQNVVT